MEYPTFKILGNSSIPSARGVSIILPDGTEVGHHFPIVSAKIEAEVENMNLITISFYAKLPE